MTAEMLRGRILGCGVRRETTLANARQPAALLVATGPGFTCR